MENWGIKIDNPFIDDFLLQNSSTTGVIECYKPTHFTPGDCRPLGYLFDDATGGKYICEANKFSYFT